MDRSTASHRPASSSLRRPRDPWSRPASSRGSASAISATCVTARPVLVAQTEVSIPRGSTRSDSLSRALRSRRVQWQVISGRSLRRQPWTRTVLDISRVEFVRPFPDRRQRPNTDCGRPTAKRPFCWWATKCLGCRRRSTSGRPSTSVISFLDLAAPTFSMQPWKHPGPGCHPPQTTPSS